MTAKVNDSLFERGLCSAFKEYGFIFAAESEQEREFFSLLNRSGDAVAVFSRTGTLAWASNAFERLFGTLRQKKEEAWPQKDGGSIYRILAPLYHAVFREKIAEALTSFSVERFEPENRLFTFRGYSAHGEICSFEGFFAAFWRNGDSQLLGVFRNISDHRMMQRRFQRLEDNYSTLSETINEAIIRIDEKLDIVYANSAVEQTFGYTKEELTGEKFSILFPPEIFTRYKDDFVRYFYFDDAHRSSQGLQRSIEVLGRHKRRGVSPMEMSFGNSSYINGRTLTCIIRDITSRKNLERKLRKLAYHDKLTSLGNRDLFNKDMETFLEKIEDYPGMLGALMFLDLDGFKAVNDTLGHKAGDALLVETAGRLRRCLRESDSIYRFGGDEFVILLPHIHSADDAALVADKILAVIREPYCLESKERSETTSVSIGVSIGIALFPHHGDDTEALVRTADIAMYAAKEAGKNQFSFYREALETKAGFQLKIEQGIGQALSNDELDLHYQPLVDIEGKFLGAEALLRWENADLGRVSPDVFIPVAEEKGLMFSFGIWALERACRSLKEFARRGEGSNGDGRAAGSEALPFVSINISSAQIGDGRFVDTLTETIRRHGVAPSSLKLELSEETLMQEPRRIIPVVEEIRDKNPGIGIVMDDFGTGYSSLSYLSELPIDSLKIDTSFVSNLENLQNRKIVDSLVGLAGNLGIGVMAEGVETEEQFEYFTRYPSAILQGHYFSAPVPKTQLLGLMDQEYISA